MSEIIVVFTTSKIIQDLRVLLHHFATIFGFSVVNLQPLKLFLVASKRTASAGGHFH